MTELDDAAKRIVEEFNMHRLADPSGSLRKWVAFRLSDGSSDHELYESKHDAARHQHSNELQYAYMCIGPFQITEREARHWLDTQRRMYRTGRIKSSDPDDETGGLQPIKRMTRRDEYRQVRAFFRGDLPPTNIVYGRNN